MTLGMQTNTHTNGGVLWVHTTVELSCHFLVLGAQVSNLLHFVPEEQRKTRAPSMHSYAALQEHSPEVYISSMAPVQILMRAGSLAIF